MKTVTSEGNLSAYYNDRNRMEVLDIDKLNKKIKSIKSALKIAERHNEELHMKLKNQKENHQMEIIQLENEYKKYKELYEMLLEKYDLNSLELKEYKKKVKKIEIEQYRASADSDDEYKEFKETIFKQEKELVRLKEENRLLYEQVFEKNNKLKELEGFISKHYVGNQKSEHKDKSFLASLKSAIETKNEEFEKVVQEKGKLLGFKQQLQREHGQLGLKLAKAQTQLEYQRKLGRECKERGERFEKQAARLSQQNKAISLKYQQLLSFSYDSQKDMQRQLHSLTKELFRKDHK